MNNKINKYIEKKIIKYVITTVDGRYLKKIPSQNEYYFVDDIEIATKAMDRSTINQILRYYYLDTNSDIELLTIPVEITYELINETS